MDELRGTNIQVILHVKEGLGFGFLRTPFIVSGSLNGYMLETDPAVPCHAPVFDAELVWEADKRRFRSLRVQNVPIKVEVYATATQGRKEKIGYLMLSLLGAQPCPSNKFVDVKHTWHRLLGVRSEGKCCHPQLLMSLTVEDRTNTLTPRNELRMFHSNEVVYPSACPSTNPPTMRSMHNMTINEYLNESKKTATSPDIQPRLICDEGLIEIGEGKYMFILSFVIGAVENLDLLLAEKIRATNESVDCCVTYSVFTHNIMTDRVAASLVDTGMSAHFNQRTSLRLRSDLPALTRYFMECPHLVIKICAAEKDVGICSMDLRKLVPTDNLNHFVTDFCNTSKSLAINERCFILRMEEATKVENRRPYVDVEMTLKYLGHQKEQKKPSVLSARSASQLESAHKESEESAVRCDNVTLEVRSGSCTHFDQDVASVAYTNMAVSNTGRYKNAAGDSVIQTNEIADMIKKMCDSFASSQEKLLASNVRPTTSDMQVQCDELNHEVLEDQNIITGDKVERDTNKLETSKSDSCIRQDDKVNLVKSVLSSNERDAIMQRFVDELEDWKEKQQELFKCQLKRKEDYHLELLSEEWAKKRVELECKLSKGIEQCRTLAMDLSRATDDFRLRGYRNTEREKKLLEAKKALESHYTAKYQELRDASQKMEDDMNRQIKLKDIKIEELEARIHNLDKQMDVLKTNLMNSERDSEHKYSGLTKDQTTSLIQELRCLEEKLDSAVQSKSFFKQQWARAVRELHAAKLTSRRALLEHLHQERQQLHQLRLETIEDQEENTSSKNEIDMKKLKDDFYVDILANTPVLETQSIIDNIGPGGIDIFEDTKDVPKSITTQKLNEMISQRDLLMQEDSPNEDLIKQLNHDIRNMLLNCGT